MNDFKTSNISNLAQIHPTAQIGNHVTISPFSYIDKNVVIEDGTWIGPNVTIFEGARIGKNCRIFPGAVISAIPQDLKFEGEKTTVEIGDNTTIREYVTINRGTKYAWTTKVGKNCLLMAYVHIAHDCLVGDNVILVNNVNLAGHVTVDDYAILEGLVAVQQFLRIGKHAFVAGGSLVRKNIPPYIKVAREPLSYTGVNSIGLARRGFSRASIVHIQNIYRLIFVTGYSLNKALALVTETIEESQEKTDILNFIENSKQKGIIKSFSSLSDSNNLKKRPVVLAKANGSANGKY